MSVATLFLGKLVSFVTSMIQVGFPLARTRPGKPLPRPRGMTSVTLRNVSNLSGSSRCQSVVGTRASGSSELDVYT